MSKTTQTLLLLSVSILFIAPGASAVCPGICGDCNGDGMITIADSLTASQIVQGLIPLPAPGEAACCDVDDDARITRIDGLIIAQAALSLSTQLTCRAHEPTTLVEGAAQLCVVDTADTGWTFIVDTTDPAERSRRKPFTVSV